MMKITNNSTALQGINTTSGVVYLKPTETRDLDVADIELATLKGYSFLGIEDVDRGTALQAARNSDAPNNGIVDADGDGVPDSTDRTALKAKADELKIDYPKNIPTDKLNELVTAKIAEQKQAADAASTAQ